jgi:hypothetical protein
LARRLPEVGLRTRPNGTQVTDTPFDELGPVDYVVVESPAGAKNFTGEMAAELLRLVDAGTIRVIDGLILNKNEDGSVDVTGSRMSRSSVSRSPSRPSWRNRSQPTMS